MGNKEKGKKFGYKYHPLIVIDLTRTDVITVRGEWGQHQTCLYCWTTLAEVWNQPAHCCLPECCFWYYHKMVPKKELFKLYTSMTKPFSTEVQQSAGFDSNQIHHTLISSPSRTQSNSPAEVIGRCSTHSGFNSGVCSAYLSIHTDPPRLLCLDIVTELYEELNKSLNKKAFHCKIFCTGLVEL